MGDFDIEYKNYVEGTEASHILLPYALEARDKEIVSQTAKSTALPKPLTPGVPTPAEEALQPSHPVIEAAGTAAQAVGQPIVEGAGKLAGAIVHPSAQEEGTAVGKAIPSFVGVPSGEETPSEALFYAALGLTPLGKGGKALKAGEKVGKIAAGEQKMGVMAKAVTPLDSSAAKDIALNSSTALLESGGSTYNMQRGDLRGLPGYAVSIFPEHGVVIEGHATQADIEAYIEKVSKDVDLNDPQISVGTWFNREENRTYLDLSVVSVDYEDAMNLARTHNQQAIYDLGAGLEIPTEGKLASQSGKANMKAVQSLAGALLGGAFGYTIGQTDDQKTTDALAGAGLGAIAPHALSLARSLGRAKSIEGKAAKDIYSPKLKVEKETASSLQDIASRFITERDAFRRGVRSHEVTRQAGAESLASGAVSKEWMETLYPGLTANAEDLAAATTILSDEVQTLQALATDYMKDATNIEKRKSFLKQLKTVAVLEPRQMGLVTEEGRSLEYVKDLTNEINAYVEQTSGILGKMAVIDSPKRMAVLLSRMRTPEQLAMFAKQVTSPGLTDMVTEAWVNGLLGGLKTSVTNSLSNALTLASTVPQRALAAGFGRRRLAAGETDFVAPGEASELLSGYMGYVGTAWDLAVQSFKNDAQLFGNTNWKLGHTPAITATNVDLMAKRLGLPGLRDGGALAKGIDYLGVGARIPSRFLMAQDEFFKQVAFQGEMRSRAWREGWMRASAEGLDGKMLTSRAKEFRDQLMADPNFISAERRGAEDMASYLTFTKELGDYGKAFQKLASHPVGRVVFPFTTAPINLVKYANESTVLGFFSKKYTKALEAGGAEADIAKAQIALGSSLMAVVGTYSAMGIITGYGPAEKTTAAMWKTDGHRQYSINLSAAARLSTGGDTRPQTGDQWIYLNRTDPFGTLIALGADISDLLTQTQDPVLSAEFGTRAALIAGHIISTKTYVKGASQWMNALVDPTHQGESLMKSFARTSLTTVPVVGPLAKNLNAELDPIIRETQGLLDTIQSTIPGYSKDLPPRRNYWGEVQMYEGWMGEHALSPLYRSTHIKDLVVERLVEANVKLSKPEPDIGLIHLTPTQYDDYIKIFATQKLMWGQDLHGAMAHVLDQEWGHTPKSLRRDPSSLLHMRLEQVHRTYEQQARNKLAQKYPSLRVLSHELDVEKAMKGHNIVPELNLSPTGKKVPALSIE